MNIIITIITGRSRHVETRVRACEFKELHLSCARGKVLHINTAFYGRSYKHICAEGIDAKYTQNTRCFLGNDC